MSRPTEDILDDMDAAEVGAHGCLFPTGDAGEGFGGDSDDEEDDE